MSESQRTEIQEDFLYDRTELLVATNAFGMGINKSNIRFVIHYQIPGSLEAYYQEAGRAGRDGLLSEAVLLFAPKIYRSKNFLSNNLNEKSHKNKKNTKN